MHCHGSVGVLVAALWRVQLVLSGEYRGGSQGASRIKCVTERVLTLHSASVQLSRQRNGSMLPLAAHAMISRSFASDR